VPGTCVLFPGAVHRPLGVLPLARESHAGPRAQMRRETPAGGETEAPARDTCLHRRKIGTVSLVFNPMRCRGDQILDFHPGIFFSLRAGAICSKQQKRTCVLIPQRTCVPRCEPINDAVAQDGVPCWRSLCIQSLSFMETC